MTKKTREAIKATTAIIIVLLAIYLLWIYPLHEARRIVAVDSRAKPWSWSDQILQQSDTISFVTEDNITLSGYRVGPDSALGTVILLHGLTGEADRYFEAARTLAASGYAVFAYNQRGFAGDSIGYVSGGVFEADDIQSFTSRLYLENRLVRPLVIIGFDQGGTAALQALSRTDRIDFVLAANPLVSGYDWVARRKDQKGMILPRFFYPLVWWWMKQDSGYEIDPDEVGVAGLLPQLTDKYAQQFGIVVSDSDGPPAKYTKELKSEAAAFITDVSTRKAALDSAVVIVTERLHSLAAASAAN